MAVLKQFKDRTFSTIYCYKKLKETVFYYKLFFGNMCIFAASKTQHNIMTNKTISSALISVFSKDGLAPIVKKLNDLNVTIYSTGGTEKFIKDLGINFLKAFMMTF